MKPFDCAQDRLRGIQDTGWKGTPDFIRATSFHLVLCSLRLMA